jgi:hypothetical protein
LHLNVLLTTKTAFLENAMFRLLKVLPLTLALASVSLFFTACGSNNVEARFINAIPDSTNALDIDVGGVKEFSTVQFGTVSPGSNYTGVPSGNVAVEGFQTGTTTQAFPSQTINLNSGSEYTLVAVGFLSGTVNILNPIDNNTEPADSTVNFRVIEASPSGPPSVDIYFIANPVTCSLGATGCGPAITALAYQSTSTYVNLNFNSNGQGYQMFVTPHGSLTPLFSGGQAIVAGGTTLGSIRTIVLTDESGGGAMSNTALVLHDLN